MQLAVALPPLVFAASALAFSPLLQESTKLSETQQVPTVLGDVEEIRLSPDGQWVVYLADQDQAGIEELYATRRDGTGSPVKLNGSLVANGEILEFEITPDSTRVVYLAEQDNPGKTEIFSAPLTGGGSTKLNAPTTVGEVWPLNRPFAITPDGSRVVYVADQTAPAQRELWSVPVDGSQAAVSLTPGGATIYSYTGASSSNTVVMRGIYNNVTPNLFRIPADASAAPVRLITGGNVVDFELSPDDGYAVYTSNQNVSTIDDLFSIPLDGSGAAVQLSTVAYDVAEFDVNATSEYVVYRHSTGTSSAPAEAYVVPLDGSATATRLHPPLVNGAVTYDLSPDGQTVLFIDSSFPPGRTAYSVPIDLSAAPTQLTGSGATFGAMEITPDSSHLVFTGRDPAVSPSDYNLYVVPLDGSSASRPVNTPVWEITPRFTITDDSTTLVYAGNPEVGAVSELFAAPLDGSTAPVSLLGSTGPFARLGDDFLVDSGSGEAVYRGAMNQIGVHELQSVPIDASASPTVLSAPFATTQVSTQVFAFTSSPDGEWVAYNDTGGLWARKVLDGGPAVRLSPMLPTETLTSVTRPTFSSDSRFVFFAVHVDPVFAVYRAPVDGSASPLLLHSFSTLLPDDSISSLLLTPDEQTLVFTRFEPDFTGYTPAGDAYAVPVDGSGPALHIYSGGATGGAEITADGQHLVFATYETFENTKTLWTVPLDGSAPATNLTPWPTVIPPNNYAPSFDFEVAGDRVVYAANSDGGYAGADELWSVPKDGSAPATRLSGGMTQNLRTTFLVSPDRSHVAWVRRWGNDYRLYHGRVDGTGVQTLLATYPVATTTIQSIRFSPDGARIVFAADADVTDKVELFSVLVDGSQAPVRVNHPFLPAMDLWFRYEVAYQISPDSQTVVYLCDGRNNQIYELFSAPIAGGGTGTLLHDPLPSGWNVEEGFQITEDSKLVLFRMPEDDFVLPIWSARLDGVGNPVRRSGPFPAGVNVNVDDSYGTTENGTHVLYRSDEETSGTMELFSFPLKPRPRKAPELSGAATR